MSEPINETIPELNPTTDGTTGHSKGKWGYYGDIIVGIHTDCQHAHAIENNPITGDHLVAYPDFDHESDNLILALTEDEFDHAMGRLADENEQITWKEYKANLRLMALAQQAPHDCGDPECPGYQNKRKLELYDKFQRAIHEFAQAGLLT